MTLIGAFVRQETLLTALAGQMHALSVATYAFLANGAYWVMEGQVYGGWKLEIYLDGVHIESEEEALETEVVKGIFAYRGGPWIAFITGATPKLRRNRNLEELLRDCFQTTGTINVDPRDFVVVERNAVVLRLTESQITRKQK